MPSKVLSFRWKSVIFSWVAGEDVDGMRPMGFLVVENSQSTEKDVDKCLVDVI